MWEKRCDEMWNPDWKFCFTDKKYSAHTNIYFNKWNWNIFQWDCIFGFCSTSFANGICNGVVAFEQQLCVIVSHNCSILNVKCFFIYYFFSSFDSVRAVHSSIRAAIRLFCWLFSFPAFRKLVIGLRSFLSLSLSLAFLFAPQSTSLSQPVDSIVLMLLLGSFVFTFTCTLAFTNGFYANPHIRFLEHANYTAPQPKWDGKKPRCMFLYSF